MLSVPVLIVVISSTESLELEDSNPSNKRPFKIKEHETEQDMPCPCYDAMTSSTSSAASSSFRIGCSLGSRVAFLEVGTAITQELSVGFEQRLNALWRIQIRLAFEFGWYSSLTLFGEDSPASFLIGADVDVTFRALFGKRFFVGVGQFLREVVILSDNEDLVSTALREIGIEPVDAQRTTTGIVAEFGVQLGYDVKFEIGARVEYAFLDESGLFSNAYYVLALNAGFLAF